MFPKVNLNSDKDGHDNNKTELRNVSSHLPAHEERQISIGVHYNLKEEYG